MYDDTVQFFFVGCPHPLGVGPHRVETDEEVARNHVTFAVIERDDVRVIIVPEILAVHLQNLLVVHEDVGNLAYPFAVTRSHGFHPGRVFAFLDGGHLHAVRIVSNHFFPVF